MKQQKALPARSNKRPLVRGPYARPRLAISYDPELGLTHQSFKDECDITRIVETYARTGIIPTHRMEPQYGDAPESSLFEAACAQAAIRTAEADGEWSPDLQRYGESGEISDSEGVPQGVPPEAEKASPAPTDGEQGAE